MQFQYQSIKRIGFYPEGSREMSNFFRRYNSQPAKSVSNFKIVSSEAISTGSKHHTEGSGSRRYKRVMHKPTGRIFESVYDAAKAFGLTNDEVGESATYRVIGGVGAGTFIYIDESGKEIDRSLPKGDLILHVETGKTYRHFVDVNKDLGISLSCIEASVKTGRKTNKGHFKRVCSGYKELEESIAA